MTPEFSFAVSEELNFLGEEKSIFLPTKADPEATGYDVRCAHRHGVIIEPNKYCFIRLGLRMLAPPGWWLHLNPRSSSFCKKNLHTLCGVIDETYEGHIIYACQWIPEGPLYGDEVLKINFQDRIGQLIPVRREEMLVKEVSNDEIEKRYKERSAQRTGGIGSTGDK